MTNLFQITHISNNLEGQWANITPILKQAAKESLGEERRWDQRKRSQKIGC
jgi:hypothetical protein